MTWALMSLAVVVQAQTERAEEAGSAQSASDLGSQRRYEQALSLYGEGRFEEALAILRVVAERTRSPNARLAAGRCLEQLERPVEAYVEYELAVAYANLQVESGRDVYARAREDAEASSERLRPTLGFVTVSVEPTPASASLMAGQLRYRETAFGVALPITPDVSVDLVVRAAGFEERRVAVRVAAGETRNVRLSLSAIPEDEGTAEESAARRGLSRFGWSVGAVGVASAGGFAGLHVATARHYDALAARCPSGECDFDPSADRARGRRLQAGTNILLTAGITLLVSSVVALIVERVRRR